jgi:hypothetical protein
MLRCGVFTSAANVALEIAMETLRSVTSTPYEKAYAYIFFHRCHDSYKAISGFIGGSTTHLPHTL